ncbi:hypothetical protein RYX36_021298 [Vicia faba]
MKDGHTFIDVGCGWGSLTLYISKNYSNCRVTGICTSTTQKSFIEKKCVELQLQNMDIIVVDISTFEMEASYDSQKQKGKQKEERSGIKSVTKPGVPIGPSLGDIVVSSQTDPATMFKP